MEYKSLYEAKFAARYAARYNLRCARAWRKLATLIAGCELIGGSAAFGSYIASDARLAGYVGLLLAGCVALNYALHPSEKARDEEQICAAFTRLLAEHDLDLQKFCQKLDEILENPDPGFEFVRKPAYNDVAREWGRDDEQFQLGILHRFVALLA